ncbi:Plant transposase [Abeliophyllum distichum]|uniref:Plant transposase n=1 Tax=Abeliophyllum distichum TaxID=126358 RepID=A0ABD1QGK2_9LAMI
MAKRKSRGKTMLDTISNASTSHGDTEITPPTPDALVDSNGNISPSNTDENANKRRGRGPARGPRIDPGKKLELEWNDLMQPVDVPEGILDYIWNEVQETTNAPPAYRNNCLKSIDAKWRNWKSRVKTKYFSGITKEECLTMVPKEIDTQQWKILVEYWGTKEVMEAAEKNKRNREQVGPPHRTERKSCANIRREEIMDMAIFEQWGQASHHHNLTTQKNALSELDALTRTIEENCIKKCAEDNAERMKAYDDELAHLHSQIELMQSKLVPTGAQVMEASNSHTSGNASEQVHSRSQQEEKNPYTIHPSDNPGAVLVSSLLNGDNYTMWSKAMLKALSAKSKSGFVNGAIPKSSQKDADFGD